MKSVVNEIFELKDIESAIDFVVESFGVTEKKVYPEGEYDIAELEIKSGRVFDADQLFNMVKKGYVSLLAIYEKGKMVGTSALDVEAGRILFLSANGDRTVMKQLVEAMTQKRENAPDGKLDILAFQGEEQNLKLLGFNKLKTDIFYFNKIRFIAMRFNYEQIDVER